MNRRPAWLPGLPGLLGLLGLLAGLVLLAACGVPTQDRPTVVDPTNVPNNLLATAQPVPISPTTPTPTREPDPITYFVDAGKLVGVQRQLPAGSLRQRLNAATFVLLAGPTEAEQSAGLGTAIPSGVILTVANVANGQATVELTGELRNSPTEDNILAVAQIVLTATAQPEIERVLLTRDGEPMQAPLIDGSLKFTSLTASDYEPLLAR